MADRIAYVPWSRTSGHAVEYVQKVQDWNTESPNTHGQHTYDLVFYQDPNEKAIIRALPFGHRIYIKGHGQPGYHAISPNLNPGNANDLKYHDVADRLIASGLQKRWVGVIVCDNCYSAVPAGGNKAFASKFADYMRGKGYLLISFIGYFGPIDSDYSDVRSTLSGTTDNDYEYKHRFVNPLRRRNPWGPLAERLLGPNADSFELKSKWAQWRF
jgi:hypothetical protein